MNGTFLMGYTFSCIFKTLSCEMGIEWGYHGKYILGHGTFMGHSWDIHGTFMGHSWDIHGTFMGHSWDIHGTFMGHSWDIVGTWGGFQKLTAANEGMIHSKYINDHRIPPLPIHSLRETHQEVIYAELDFSKQYIYIYIYHFNIIL